MEPFARCERITAVNIAIAHTVIGWTDSDFALS
jgi:hypothetical protein